MPSHADTSAAKRLLRARERAGYGSAHEVADVFGWPDYPMDESGERALTAVRAKLYAHAFHVDPEWLISGENEPAGSETAAGGASAPEQPSEPRDEMAERIRRLTPAQRTALVAFLRAMQEG